MTTIAYRNGILAGDTRTVYSGTIESAQVRKVRRSRDGRLIGICGTAARAEPYARALLNGRAGPEMPKDEGRVVEVMPNGEVIIHEYGGNFSLGRIEYGAWGSGSDSARGAMLMGASAKKAVQVAMKVDLATGGHVQSVCLKRAAR